MSTPTLSARQAVPNLLLWRVAKSYTQAQLAMHAGVSINAVSRAERGQRLYLVNIAQLARALGISVQALVFTAPDGYVAEAKE